MRVFAAAALLAGLGAGAMPASAQNLNDLGRVLQDQVLGGRPNQDREREAYEAGRRDQDQRNYDRVRRDEDFRRDDHRRFDDAQRHERDIERQHADQERAWADERRAREQSYRR